MSVDLSVCIETVYDDEPFVDRIDRAAAVADAFEFWGRDGRNLDAIAERRDETGLELAAMVGSGAPLVDPDGVEAAVDDLRASIGVAAEIGCPTLIVTVGQEREEHDRTAQRGAIVEALSAVAADAEAAGVTLVVEPLNAAVDHPGYFLTASAEGFEIVREVGSPNVKLLFDVYHQQITEGDVTRSLTRNVEAIGHVHVADNPGRHEPGTGELDYGNVFEAIDETGYDGYVGCEFGPTGDPDEAMESVLSMR